MTSVGEQNHTSPEGMPAAILMDAIEGAREGIMPPFTNESLVHTLGLSGDMLDGLTIGDRFVGPSLRPDFTFKEMRLLIGLDHGAHELIGLTNEYAANPAQEAVASALGAVISRQIIREGDICPRAKQIVLSSTRTDIISPEVREKVEQGAVWRLAADSGETGAVRVVGVPPEFVAALLRDLLEELEQEPEPSFCARLCS